jgi:cytochrome c-type biogenesis protein
MSDVGLTTLLSLSLSAGLVAAFNPCGFAMLPAYLSYFMGLESEDETNPARNIFRGLKVALTLTAGFMLFFGTIGLLASTVVSRSAIESRIAWATLIFGILMIPLGIAMVAGFEPKLSLPRMSRGGDSRQLPSIFMFGISYAVVSLGCTAPVFFGTVVGSFTSRSVAEGTLVFVAYGAGMGLVIITLTLAMALARNEVALFYRRFLPYVNKVSGAFLVTAGLFLIFYGWWEIQVLSGDIETNRLVDLSLELQSTLTNWANDAEPTRLAVGGAFIVGGLVAWAIFASVSDAWAKWLLVGLFVLWFIVEAFGYQLDLFVLPTIRTLADAPGRIANWFMDPLRWAAAFEVLLALLIALFAAWHLRRWLFGQEVEDSDLAPDSVG